MHWQDNGIDGGIMIHTIHISVDTVIDKAVMQSASDFRALRITDPQAANVVYEDFVFLPDNRREAEAILARASVSINSLLKAHILEMTLSPNVIIFAMQIEKCSDAGQMGLFMTDYMVYSLLGWWYAARNTALSESCNLRAADSAAEVLHMLTPKFSERRVRLF